MGYVQTLQQHGICLSLDGGKIRAVPAPALTEALRHIIREHRDEIIAELHGATPAPCSPSAPGTRTPVLQVGDRILVHGTIRATVLDIHAPDDLFPLGMVDLVTEIGETGQADIAVTKKVAGAA